MEPVPDERENGRIWSDETGEPHKMKSTYRNATPFTTKDGSTIRELMHPSVHASLGVHAQSFAEATVEPGMHTQAHMHRRSEEIYHITVGTGRMTLGDAEFDIGVGDTVLIPPGTRHFVRNSGSVALKIICACTPAYADEDTVLLSGAPSNQK
jgi:mannose-6-phosphate isomerase-like protein (cupin superfamily)